MKIISYNVNGIRAAVRKGFIDWLNKNDFDIICLQETKAQPHQLQHEIMLLEMLGYHHFWHSAEKKGYSSVAIFSKQKPDKVVYGCQIPAYDREGRVIRADFGDLTIVNAYFPSGSSSEIRQAFKMRFLADFEMYIQELRVTRSHLVVVGDYNICHRAIDIHDPVRHKNSSGFLPEERAWLTQFFDNGFVDSFRCVHGDVVDKYTWWSYRAGSRARNKGWRIDYQAVSESLRAQLLDAVILANVKHSDHCPIYLELASRRC